MDHLYNLANDQFNGVYMALTEVIDYVNFLNFPKLNILKSKEVLFFIPFCIYLRKNSPLTTTFNEQIDLYASYGLINSWARRYKTPTFRESHSVEPKRLAFNQISGLLTVYMCMIAASAVVFALEMMATRFQVVKHILDFFTFSVSQRQSSKFWPNQV